MRRADRLFDIIQTLRGAKGPLTATALAQRLEVTPRTIYRDIATLQARQVPIEGAAGIGYLLRRGYDLPPLMFTAEETEAILVGALLTRRTGDPGLRSAADSVLSKIAAILPAALQGQLSSPTFFVSEHGANDPAIADMALIRSAIRQHKKLLIDYVDREGGITARRIWPIAVAYFVEATLVCAWCELRNDYRHFRADRIQSLTLTDESFSTEGGKLLKEWPEWFRLAKG
ncbi:MAG TPA: YafY family protein [Hypericibacter adhaerens]|jgi:predicted DNA-binding transcriptional regulator YafY|uniref:Transcriptional regulator n=1 Tax=Hypericibacter adhaerens TaxID=2602016 RepID=A0A5J6N0U8_9PROT|nr:YafY family protein [Hypericibacter adhaerens]QEX22180.1 transcriptional regulator [Hypericibacter adhaerens]HWA46456.1 YafY family protein [Hypericibacter adhaerens]